MIKELKKTIIFSLVFSVFFASFLCCCLTGVSHANSTDIKSENMESHCHSNASKTTNSKDSKDCECEHTAAILDVKGFDLLKSNLSLAKPHDDLFSQSVSFSKTTEETAILTEHSPPVAHKRASPLYLEFSALRI